MKKMFIGAICCLAFILALPAYAARPEPPADGIRLNRGGKKEVAFNHSTHQSQSCANCHHPVEGKENFLACATTGCHDNLDPRDKSGKSYNRIIHLKKGARFQTCFGCHTQAAGCDKEKKRELTACSRSRCHP